MNGSNTQVEGPEPNKKEKADELETQKDSNLKKDMKFPFF